jgi:hypothetical protein
LIETKGSHYPIPGCDAWISLPVPGITDTITIDGALTLDQLRWLIAHVEQLSKNEEGPDAQSEGAGAPIPPLDYSKS